MVVECDYAYSLRRRASAINCDRQQLADQCWYHGRIKRVQAQQLLHRDGDFLVRDSISKAGGYVLTGLWRGQPLHFEINQTPSSDPRYEIYHFEDEQFRSVVDLVEFYHNHRRRVTESSGFVLCTPVVNEKKLHGGQLREQNNNEAEALQIEIEAAYAEYNGRSPENRFQRTLSQQALLNSARRRVPVGNYKSEQDLMKAALSLTENFGCDEDYPSATKLTNAADRDEDYSEVDYAAMDDLGDLGSHVSSSFAQFGLVPKPVASKRHSELIDRHNLIKPSVNTSMQFGTSRSSSNLNRIHASTSQDSSVPPPVLAPSVADAYDTFLDRAHSCSNLFSTTRWRRPSSSGASQISSSTGASSSSGDSGGGFRRYPSVKIEPAPLLPARSNTSLNAIDATASANRDNDSDYDHPATSASTATVASSKAEEKDYDDPQRQPLRQFQTQVPPRPAPKPTLAQLRAISSAPKQLRNLCTALHTSDPRQVALCITEADCQAFQRSPSSKTAAEGSPTTFGRSALSHLLNTQNVAYRQNLLIRAASVYLTTTQTIEKSSKPSETLEAWARIAQCLQSGIGNSFAFGSIMEAVENKLTHNSRLMADLGPSIVSLLQQQLLPEYRGLRNSTIAPNSTHDYCFLPYVQPYLKLELSTSRGIKATASSSEMPSRVPAFDDNMDILWSFLQNARRLLSSCDADSVSCRQVMRDAESPEARDNRFTTDALVPLILGIEPHGSVRESQLSQVLQMYLSSGKQSQQLETSM